MLSQLKEEKKKEIDLQGVKDNAKKVASQIRHEGVDNTKPTRAPSYIEDTSHKAETKREKSVNDYALMDPKRNSNGKDSDFEIDTEKPFKSRYVDDNGAWTHEAVDDGYVEFGDYIKDRREGVDNGISFNAKQFNPKFSNVHDEPYEAEVSYVEPREDDDSLAYYYDEDKEYLDGFEIDEVSDDYAGVGDFFDPKSPFFRESSILAHRAVWYAGAELYLKNELGYETSAWLLKHSLQRNPEKVVRDNYSRIAWLINNHPSYLIELDKVIKDSNGKTIDKTFDVNFENGDLYYSIHRGTVHVNGYKRDDGKWFVKAKLTDTYDYTQFMTFMGDNWYDFSLSAGIGTVANDMAVLSQNLGAINPYEIEVNFYTVR